MIEVKGYYNTAKIFAQEAEAEAIEQIQTLCNQEFAKDSRIRIMPDVHTGAGCTIGTTMTIHDKLVPNLVGVDIGCGMETVCLGKVKPDLEKLDRLIYEKIPSGFQIRQTPHPFHEKVPLEKLFCSDKIHIDRAQKSIGTLGGGNHFIEVDVDEMENYYLVIHSGSRHLGLEVANYYQKSGYEALNKKGKTDIKKLIEQYKEQGRQQELEKTIQDLKKQEVCKIPYALCYIQGELFQQYLSDMKWIQYFAALNRQAMMEEILNAMQIEKIEQFTTIHNYIDTDTMILRKGAVSAKKGEKFLIPINMKEGSLICIGKGNLDWNESSPHGAGRLMSRTKAKKTFSLEEFCQQMQGIYSSTVSIETLDECPMAYKPIDDIVSQIGPTAEISMKIKPIYNFKAKQ